MNLQPVNIGGIECDALIHHELAMEAEIPDYPVEKGYSVQDTMILKPRTLSLTVIVTNTPITFRSHASPGRVQEVAARFQELYQSRQLITVTSAKGSFQNMGITSLSLPYDVSTKTSLEIPIALKEVLTTTAQTVTSHLNMVGEEIPVPRQERPTPLPMAARQEQQPAQWETVQATGIPPKAGVEAFLTTSLNR